MRLATLARRSVAVTAVTALLTGTGLATGVLTGTANAEEVYSVSPQFPANSAPTTFVIQGRQFASSNALSVTLHKVTAADGQADIDADSIDDNTASCAPSTAGITCGDTLTFSADLTNAAPGAYDVVVTNSASLPPGEVDTCAGCVTILGGAPTLTSSARYNSSDGQLVFSGSNLSKGTKLEFYKTDANGALNGIEPYISYVPTTTSGSTTTSGYVSSTTFRATYTYTPGQVSPGLHKVRAVSSDGQVSNYIDFYQPQINSMSPSVLGQGATLIPTTVTGVGFHPSSTFSISSVATSADISVAGPATVTPTSVLENVSVVANSAAQARVVTVRGADGGYVTNGNVFAVAVGPKFASSNPVTPNTRGQGSDSIVTVSGTGFNAGTTFNFGSNVTATTDSVSGGTTASVHVVVADTAPLTTRSVVALNTDFGTATLANGFTVTTAPRVTSLSPPSASPGSGPFNVLLDGSGFTSGQNFSLAVVPSTGITVGSTITRVSDTRLQTTFTIAAGTAAGPRDIIVTNTSTGGRSTCTSCFSINSLSITPPAALNNAVRNVTLTSNLSGAPLSGSTSVRIFLPGAPSYQGPIAGTGVVYDPTTGKITVNLDLTNVATGAYNVETTTGNDVLICTGCFTVTAPANPTVTSVTPGTAGQGATARAITIAGTGFSPGETVTFAGSGVTASNVTYVSPTSITAQVDVAPGATVGKRNVTVTNIGDGKAGSLTNGFEVTLAPSTTAIDPAKIGQNGVVDVTLTGTGYAANATADFGAGTTNVLKDASGAPTKLVYTVTISDTADTTAPRTVTVTNPDGGVGALSNALTLTPAPRLTGISPNTGKPGDTLTDVTVSGTGLVADGTTMPQVVIAGVTVTVKSVSADGTSLVADFAVDPAATAGARAVRLVNPDVGQSITAGAFTVATLPTAPKNVQVTPGKNTATVTWEAPDSDGGVGIQNYVVDDGDASTNNTQTVAADQRTATLTGLTGGTTYTFSVAATNSVGTGTAATVSGTPYDVPTAPTSVSAAAGDGRLTVSFSGANPRGSAISEYTIQLSNGSGSIFRVVTSSPAVVTGLANGTTYTITVAAKNAAGYGAYSTASATGTPAFASRLTATKAPATVIAGQAVTYSGRLTRTDGTAIAGRTVSVRLIPDIGASRVINVTTASDGTWRTRVTATYNTTVRASFAGGSDAQPVNAAAFRFGVQTRVTRTSPASGATTSASTTLAVRGTTSPNKAGRTIGLYRGTTLIARATVGSDGRFTINSRLARGTYTLYIQIGTTSGNITGRSTAFVVKRS